jgi:hypothetical protein
MKSLNLRPATPADVPQILAFIRDLAAYEREPDAVHATETDLLRDGFGSTKRFDCVIAELTQTPRRRPASLSTSTTIPPGAATRASTSKTSMSAPSIAGRESAKLYSLASPQSP